MIDLHPTIITRNGRNEYVVLPHDEYLALQELIEDASDLLALRQAKADDDPSIPGKSLEEMCRKFGVED